MKPITIRNLPPSLQKLIQRHIRQRRISTNKAVIELLSRLSGVANQREQRLYHDLDYLSGSWDRRKAETFDEALVQQRTMDDELWK